MDLDDIAKETKSAIEEAGKAFVEFKKANDERLAKIEKGTGGVAELKEKLAKMDPVFDTLTSLQQKYLQLEVAMKRSGEVEEKLEGRTSIEKKFDLAAKAEFLDFARKGGKSDFSERIAALRERPEFKAMSVQSDPDGGYYVHPDMTGRMAKRIFERSPIRSVAGIQAITTDALEGPIDIDDAEFGKATEKTLSGNRKTPQIGMWRIPTHEKDTSPLITQKLLEDSAFDPETWLANKIADRRAREEGIDSLFGTGVGEMTGILTKPAGSSWGQIEDITGLTSLKIEGDDLLNLQFALKGIYRQNARYAMHRLTFREVRKLKDQEGRYLWEPSWQVGQPSQLLGLPVIEFDDLTTAINSAGDFTAGTIPIICADFNEGYQIVDRLGLSVLRDPFTQKPFVEFYTRYRVGGDVHVSEAIKRLKVKA